MKGILRQAQDETKTEQRIEAFCRPHQKLRRTANIEPERGKRLKAARFTLQVRLGDLGIGTGLAVEQFVVGAREASDF